jgi:hypothetical protein
MRLNAQINPPAVLERLAAGSGDVRNKFETNAIDAGSNMNQSSSNLPAPTGGDFILYQTGDGGTRIEVRFSGETVWLSLNQMADLFQRDKSVISKHIKNMFEEGELKPDSVVANFATTAADGKTYQVDFYNLDVIISVGYRVKSHRGTLFRQWATQRLFEERELAPEATVAKFATVQTEGGRKVGTPVEHCSRSRTG